MAIYNQYIFGDYFVTCDRCGEKRLASECTLQMNKEQSNILVCTDKCLDQHNPQVDLAGIPDNPATPLPRPGDGYTKYPLAVAVQGNTTLGTGQSLTDPSSPLFSINGPDQPND